MEWISVKDRLPKLSGEEVEEGYVQIAVLAWDTPAEEYSIAWYQPEVDTFYDKAGWFGGEVSVTHWQPLPEPPKED